MDLGHATRRGCSQLEVKQKWGREGQTKYQSSKTFGAKLWGQRGHHASAQQKSLEEGTRRVKLQKYALGLSKLQ